MICRKFLKLETFCIFVQLNTLILQYFNTLFLENVDRFLETLDLKSANKIVYNIKLAEQTNDPRLLKKVHPHIWEFRTKTAGNEIRLLAFWDKTNSANTLVVATHGFVKKTWKIPSTEIERALKIRDIYFDSEH